ncbi:hypothetical protein ACFYO7_30760 [Nocardia salmonicida]|uniref:hypothetical protein n=1 Tax=Nocardia salmonicida TaxID=53431 RepID=UPI00367CAB33
MTMNVKGAPDMVDHNGTAGWGVSNRLIDPRALLGLEIAWFMYNGSHGAMGATAGASSPVANVLGADMPHGFFLMVKRWRARCGWTAVFGSRCPSRNTTRSRRL